MADTPPPQPTTPPPEWDEGAYLAANPDVAQAVTRGIFRSGHDHYARYGRQEGRPVAGRASDRTQAAIDLIMAHAVRTAGRPAAAEVAAELVAAVRATGAARYGGPGFSLPSLPDPVVIRLDGPDGGPLRQALAVLGTMVTGEAGPNTRLMLDRSDLRRGESLIRLYGCPGGLVALGRGASVPGPVRLEGPDQVFVIGDTARENQRFGPIAIRGSRAGVAFGRECSTTGAMMVVNGDGTGIVLGDDCMMGHGTEIAAADGHGVFDLAQRRQLNLPASIEIGPHVWLGAHCRVMKGVRIGAGTVVAAGAVVTRDLPGACMAAGVPAKVVRTGASWSRSARPSSAEMARIAARLRSLETPEKGEG